MVEENLILAIMDNPLIYDMSLKGYHEIESVEGFQVSVFSLWGCQDAMSLHCFKLISNRNRRDTLV